MLYVIILTPVRQRFLLLLNMQNLFAAQVYSKHSVVVFTLQYLHFLKLWAVLVHNDRENVAGWLLNIVLVQVMSVCAFDTLTRGRC